MYTSSGWTEEKAHTTFSITLLGTSLEKRKQEKEEECLCACMFVFKIICYYTVLILVIMR